jgi:hypothetical protein
MKRLFLWLLIVISIILLIFLSTFLLGIDLSKLKAIFNLNPTNNIFISILRYIITSWSPKIVLSLVVFILAQLCFPFLGLRFIRHDYEKNGLIFELIYFGVFNIKPKIIIYHYTLDFEQPSISLPDPFEIKFGERIQFIITSLNKIREVGNGYIKFKIKFNSVLYKDIFQKIRIRGI